MKQIICLSFSVIILMGCDGGIEKAQKQETPKESTVIQGGSIPAQTGGAIPTQDAGAELEEGEKE
jgi:uncharacterized lipoprotein NlpE involved in copper resistance